jgi:hypothetical protein
MRKSLLKKAARDKHMLEGETTHSKTQKNYEVLERGRAFSVEIMGDHTAVGTFPGRTTEVEFCSVIGNLSKAHTCPWGIY